MMMGWREGGEGEGERQGSSRMKLMGYVGGTSPGTLELFPTPNNADEPGLSTSATLVVHFLKAPPAPTLALAPVPARHLCTPRQDYGVLITSEDPDLASGHGPYSFALGPNPTVQRDWRLQPLNGT